jgi:hydroxyacylglutathione hydrolase
MNLEDHLGDIIRKGRTAANVSPEAAAKAAGLTEAELAALEESGKVVKKPDFAALATLTGQSAGKLERIANGWLPSEKDLSVWRELRRFQTEKEGIVVNNYLVWDEVSREGALFDTGWDAQPAIAAMEENQVVLKHIFLTHSHDDHIAGLGAVREKYPKAHVHSGSKHAPPQQRIRANDFTHLGSLRITNRDTPGHAEDGIDLCRSAPGRRTGRSWRWWGTRFLRGRWARDLFRGKWRSRRSWSRFFRCRRTR